MKTRYIFLAISAAFISSAAYSSACSVDYGDVAFRCDPSLGSDACPDGYRCCSDDPAAFDLSTNQTIGVTPDYDSPPGSIVQAPIFSDGNNVLSRTGMCISDTVRSDLSADSRGLKTPAALGCPVPCNPEWASADIQDVCNVGKNSSYLCCQTVELDFSDCVFDGDLNCYRPVSGEDIPGVAGNNPPAVIDRVDSDGNRLQGQKPNWSPGSHATMQAPGATTQCELFIGGNQDRLAPCYQSLSVANRRGFCLELVPGVVESCPLSATAYRDACEQLNDANGLSCG